MNKKQFMSGVIAATAFGAITLTSVQANALTNGPDLDSPHAIHIHKHETQDSGTVKGTGAVANPLPTGKPIPNVTYKVQHVKTAKDTDVTKAGLANGANWKALEGLQANDPSIVLDTATAVKTGKTDANGDVNFTDLEAGVYLVTEDDSNLPKGVQPVGAEATNPFLVVLPSRINNEWNNEVNVYPKSAVTGVDKTAGPQKPGKAGKGSDVSWNITSHLAAPNPKKNAAGDVDGAYTYTKVEFNDTLDERLTVDNVANIVTEVKFDGVALDAADYKVTGSAGRNFHFELTESGLKKITKKGNLTFVLNTKLNVDDTSQVKNADGTPKPLDNEISNTTNAGGPTGKDATISSTDSNDPNHPELKREKPVVYFGNAKLTKKDADNKKVLEGAKFKVYTSKEDAQKDTNAITFGANNETVKTSAADGTIEFDGLVADPAGKHYFIRETEAPAGYLLNGGDNDIQEISVTPNEINASATKEFTDKPVPVFALPLTGGTGTAVLMTAGGVVLAGGLIVTVARRRKANA